MTILVFESRTKADVILKEIAVTPFGVVWTFHDPDGDVNEIQYATDGEEKRCAVCHNFSEEDRDWLEAYLDGVSGVQVLDALPDDWVPQPVFEEVIVT